MSVSFAFSQNSHWVPVSTALAAYGEEGGASEGDLGGGGRNKAPLAQSHRFWHGKWNVDGGIVVSDSGRRDMGLRRVTGGGGDKPRRVPVPAGE